MPQSRKSPRAKKQSTLPLLEVAVAGLIASFGLLLGLQFLGTAQDVRQQASSTPTVKLRMQAQTLKGGELRIDFLVNSGTYAIAGTQLAAKVTGVTTSDLSLDFSNSLGLEKVIERISSRPDGAYIEFTQFAPLDKNRAVNTNNQELKISSVFIRRNSGGTFTVTLDNSTAIPVVGNDSIRLDAEKTKTFTLAQATNSPASSTSPGQKKSCNQNCSTDTECSSNYCYKGQCRSSENLEDSSCTGVGDQGIHRSCNEYCADKNECGAGYSCYFNRCRNPRNLGNQSCSNPASPRPVVKTTTAKGAAVTPLASPAVTPIPSLSPSPSPSPSPSANIYTEGSLRVSPSPTTRKASPAPSPKTSQPQNAGTNRLLRGGIILLLALGIVIPVGIYLYRRVR